MLETRVEAFESAWIRGERPDLAEFLPGRHEDDPTGGRLLFELVHAELEFRVESGEAARVEEYLERFPQIAAESEPLAELIGAEFRLRRPFEPALGIGEYGRRFPRQIGRVAELLASDDTVADAVPAAGPPGVSNRPRLPGFDLGRVLGRGGMGVVYEALDLELRRPVAVKVVHAGDDPAARERLRREAEAAAALRHPNVVEIHRTVRHGGGLSVVMELLPGGTLADRICGTPLPPRQAAEAVEPIARAVAHAHANGLIHRDLKPANVLFTADGTPKVADFGLAKRLEDDSALTRTGTAAGSPSYMAPEQARGAREVGPAADVWSLGAVLYEALTGRPPFRGPSAVETLELLTSRDPVPPRRFVPKLPRDIETICLRCLQKDPAQRYGSAGELADDLSRFLRGATIRARPVSAFENARRWAMRHRAVTALGVLLIAAVVGGTTATLCYAASASESARSAAADRALARASERKAERHEAEARHQESRARSVIFAADVRRAAEAVAFGDPRHAAELVDRHSDEAESHPFVLNVLGRAAHAPSRSIDRFDAPAYFVCVSPDRRMLAACGASGEIRLYETGNWRPTKRIAAGQGELNGLAFTAGGTRLASAGDDGTVVLWDLPSGAALWRATVFEEQAYETVFGLNDELLAACGHDARIRLLDALTGEVVGSLDGHNRTVESISITPDGRTLLSSSADGSSAAWDLATRSRLWTETGSPDIGRLTDVAVSDDGRWAVFGSERRSVTILEVATGRLVYRGPVAPEEVTSPKGASYRAVAFAAGGSDVIVAADGGNLSISPLGAGEPAPASAATKRFWSAPHDGIRCLAAAEQGVVSASDDGAVIFWDYRGAPASSTQSLDGAFDAAWVDPPVGSPCVAVAARSGQYLMHPDDGKVLRLGTGSWVAVAASAERALFASELGTLECFDFTAEPKKLWERRRGKFLRDVFGLTNDETRRFDAAVVPSPRGGAFIVSADAVPKSRPETEMHALLRIDGATGHTLAQRPLTSGRGWPAVSPDGETVAVSSTGGEVLLLAAGDLTVAVRFTAHPTQVDALAFSPDGTILATAGYDGRLVLWSGTREVRSWRAGASLIRRLQFSPDGRLLLGAFEGQAPRLWDISNGQLLLDCGRLANSAGSAEAWLWAGFSPSGERIAGGHLGGITILDGRPAPQSLGAAAAPN